MAKQTEGRSTVYNSITSEDKLEQVCEDNLQLEDDFLEYLTSTDRAKSTIKQYKANLHVFWCWNLEFNKNKNIIKYIYFYFYFYFNPKSLAAFS